MSTQILVVYASSLGNTKKMAEAVSSGVRSIEDCKCVLKDAKDAHQTDAQAADAIILGSPVRHRSLDARVKDFIERVLEQLWLSDDLIGKVGGVFTVGGGFGDCGAGCDITQVGLLASLAACGMILVPFPKTAQGSTIAGSHWGPHGRSGGKQMEPNGVTAEMLKAAYSHGANIGRAALLLKGNMIFPRENVSPSPETLKLFRQYGM